MVWKLMKTDLKQSDKALVEHFYSMTPVPSDRVLRKPIIEMLKRELSSGTFRIGYFDSCYCEETRTCYRVNGKHTSVVLHNTPAQEWPGGRTPYPVVCVTHYHADTLSDVADLYNTFDDSMSSRRQGDVNRSIAASVSQIGHVNIPARTIDGAVSGIAFSKYESDYTRKTSAKQRGALLRDHSDFVLWLNELMKNDGDMRRLRKTGVVAAMFLTWQRDASAASHFWVEVAMGTSPDPQSPTRRLNKLLLTKNAAKGNVHSMSGSKALSMHEWLVKSLHAWNAWRTSGTTDLKYYGGCKVPRVA